MNKPPAFQFYANDWLSSTKIALMSAEQERGYLRLLCHCWNDPTCSLPDDDEVLARLSLMGEGWLKGGCHLVRSCFVPDPNNPGRLINEKLSEIRKNQDEWRRKSAEGGRKSAESRAQKTAARQVRTRQTVVQPPLEANGQPNGNSSVFSLQSSIDTETTNVVSSSESAVSGLDDPPILTFPTVGNGPKEWHLTLAKIDEYRESFPGVDVLVECRHALQWCRDNPTRRKTAKKMAAFLSNWLTRAQNDGRRNGSRSQSGLFKTDPLEGVEL